jgi:hypothetical protein
MAMDAGLPGRGGVVELLVGVCRDTLRLALPLLPIPSLFNNPID